MISRVQKFLAAGEAAMDARHEAYENELYDSDKKLGNYIAQCFDSGYLSQAIDDYRETVIGEREWDHLIRAVCKEYPAMNPAKIGALFAKFLADVALRYAEEEMERDEKAERDAEDEYQADLRANGDD